jgi:hypothetical protein
VAVDASTPGSPGFWLVRLGQRLADDQARMSLLDAYFSGNHPLPEGHRRHRDVFRSLQKQARANYVGLVVEAVRERLHVEGFRAGGEGAEADKVAWGRWQASSLDADSGLVHLDALIFGRSYAIIGVDPSASERTPVITSEDPRFVIHEADPVHPRVVRAALKTWVDDVEKMRHAVVYLPDSISYFVAKASTQSWRASTWDVDVDEGDGGVSDNPFGEVPVVPFVNRPRNGTFGLGEFEDVTDIQDRINNTILDRLVIAKMQAYRQRWAKGIKLQDENGNPISLDPGADLLWAVEDENAAFGDFQQADLAGILRAAEADVRDLAAIARTPAHYLLAQMVNISADALLAAEIGLVAKAQERQRQFGESWEQVMRLAAIAAGDTPQDDGEVIWKDPQTRTVAELYDAASKAQSAGLPWRARMELLGFTPQAIDRMEAERTADALLLAQFPQLEPAGTPVRYTDTMRVSEKSSPGQPMPMMTDAGAQANGQQPAGQ